MRCFVFCSWLDADVFELLTAYCPDRIEACRASAAGDINKLEHQLRDLATSLARHSDDERLRRELLALLLGSIDFRSIARAVRERVVLSTWTRDPSTWLDDSAAGHATKGGQV